MGNASVATADIATAPFTNPAMLVFQKSDAKFALLLPAVGLMLDDSDGMLDLIDQYRATSDQKQQLAIVSNMFGKEVNPQLAAASSIGYAGHQYALAFGVRADVYGSGGLTNPALTASELSDPTKNLLNIESVSMLEIGVSGAMKTRLMGKNISIGVTPKVINVEQRFFSESISTIDTGSQSLLDQSAKRDLGSYNSFDVGAVVELSRNIHVGLVARNVIENKIRFISVSGQPATVTLASSYRAGIAYRNRFMTLGADMDLTEVDPPITTASSDKSKMLYWALNSMLSTLLNCVLDCRKTLPAVSLTVQKSNC